MSFSKKIYFILGFILLASVVLAGCGGKDSGTTSTTNTNGTTNTPSKNESADNKQTQQTPDKVIELNVNAWTPSTHHYAYNVYEPWKEFVEEKTNGRIQVNLYYGGTLGKSTSVYQDISGGLFDVSLVVPTYYYDTDWFPLTLGNLPFALPGSEAASKVLPKFGEKYISDKLKSELIIMDTTSTDTYDLFSHKPVRSLADLKGLKVRVSGENESTFIKNVDAVPVTVPTEELYESLQKKTLDATFSSPIGAVDFKTFEPAPYISQIGVYVNPITPVMNTNFLNQLPDDLKKMFEEELNPKLSELFRDDFITERERAEKTLAEAVAGRGEVIKVSENEMKHIREAGKPAWDTWVKVANEKGFPGEEMVNEFIKLLKEAGYPAPF